MAGPETNDAGDAVAAALDALLSEATPDNSVKAMVRRYFDRITAARKAKKSWEQIATALKAAGVEVAPGTLRQYHSELVKETGGRVRKVRSPSRKASGGDGAGHGAEAGAEPKADASATPPTIGEVRHVEAAYQKGAEDSGEASATPVAAAPVAAGGEEEDSGKKFRGRF